MEERIERLEELVDGMRGRIATLKDRVAALEREAQERQETALQVDGKEFSQAIGKHTAEIFESLCGSIPLTDDTGDKTTTSADFDIKKEIQKQLQLLLDSEGKEHFYGEDMNIARAKLELLLKVYPYDLFSDSKDSFS